MVQIFVGSRVFVEGGVSGSVWVGFGKERGLLLLLLVALAGGSVGVVGGSAGMLLCGRLGDMCHLFNSVMS